METTLDTFTITYLPSHDDCKLNKDGLGSCWCTIGGFPTYRQAAIFAYHHCLCRLCKKYPNEYLVGFNSDNGADYYEYSISEEDWSSMSSGDKMEAIWNDSNCSAEWWITKDD